MKCGLLGRKLSHSYSPKIHSMLGSYDYVLFEKEPEELEYFLKNGDFSGINVTIPYKKKVIEYLDDLSPAAKEMGAVNTIVRRSDGSLIGHNTDCFGFSSMVKKSGLQVAGKKVLVLGSGGASATASAVLQKMGAHAVIISRSGESNYDNLHIHADASVIVNATPVGMYPDTGISPVNPDLFPKLEGVLDLIYNPARTQLLLDAEKRNLKTENGLWMLVAQAKESAEWFTGQKIPDTRIAEIYSALKSQTENVVLIGMPGCGKSTVGPILAKKMQRRFADADTAVAEKAGISIPEIFEKFGEPGFRELETAVLAELGKQSGLVIATGGGCVTMEQNYPLLHQNGCIFWLQRELSTLSSEGRPLSKSGNPEQMYRIRKSMYQSFADHTVDNNGTAEECAQKICSIWEANL